LWSNGVNTEDQTDIGPGNYTVTVQDANGCSIVRSDEVLEPTELAFAPNSITINNVSCNGLSDGGIGVTVEGGSPPYQYLWSSGETTPALSGYAVGTYSLTVVDNNGCSLEESFEITEPGVLSFVECNSEDVTTTEGMDGTATVVITGGTAPYTYSWSDGQTTNPAINLAAGSYDVSVMDANGCETTGTCTVQGISCRDFEVDINTIPINCNNSADGSIEVLVDGGSGSITYSWVPDVSNLAIGSGLDAGSYAIEVTDEVGCNEIVTVQLTNPTSIDGTISKTDASCNDANDGSLDLQLSGGTPPYTYSWSNGATQEDLSNLPPGDYSVTVVDASGCIFIISETISEPSLLREEISGEVSNATCTNSVAGAIDITITGGILPYTYEWSSGETTEDISNLTPGNYFVTVTDANQCTFGVGYDVLEATSCSSDLALIIELAPGQPTEFKEGDEVTFAITIVNQGEDDLENVTIIDYFPTGLILSDSFWNSTGANMATLDIMGMLDAGSTTVVDITFVVNSLAPNGFLLNYAEVAGAVNSLGDPYQDVDSTPDTINGNDAGAVAGTPTDNTFDGNGIDDEDDHDVVSLFIQSFDLALQTTLLGPPGTPPGEEVTLLVTITNQGSIDAYNIVINQSTTDDLILNDSDWTQVGDIITTTVDGPLLAGESIEVPVDFILSQEVESGVIVVVSEIGGATFEDGTVAVDADSTPDSDFANDAGGAPGSSSDNVIIGDGTGITGSTDANTDEDDHDPVIIVIDDLLIDLELDVSLDADVVYSGDVITWTISVENMGPADASGVDVINQFGADLGYVSDNSDEAYDPVSGIWSIGDIAIGETVVIEVLTIVEGLDDMGLTSEVLAANEDDVDSTPGNNIEGEDDQDSGAPEPFRSVSIEDPCNCEIGIDIDGDGSNDLAYEGIVISSASTNENWIVTAATGLVDGTGQSLTSATLDNIEDGNYLLQSYIVADGITSFAVSFEETGSGATLSITGGPCAPCPSEDPNEPPDIGPDQRTCTEPITPIGICVEGFDPNGDNVMLVDVSTTYNCSIDIINDTCFTYIPLPGLIDITDTITVIACDDGEPILCDELKVLVDVKEDCDEPLCDGSDSNEIILDCTELITPLEICVPDFCKLDDASETADDAETISGSIIDFSTDNCIVYTPLPGIDGVDTVFIYGSDAFGELDTVTAYIIVTEDCDNYYNANDDETNTTVNQPVTIDILGNDGNNSDCELEDLKIGIVTTPSNGTAIINADGTATYTPDDGFIGQDNFEYEVCCLSVCDIATVTINVGESIPEANNDSATTDQVIIDVLANDDPFFQNCNEDDLTIDIISAPFSGSVAFYSIGNIEYTPNEGFSGEDSFEYQVCCADVCDIATVTVNVNEKAAANDDSATTGLNEPVIIDVLGNN